MAKEFKTILYVPIHVEIDVEYAEKKGGVDKVLHEIKRELSEGGICVQSGFYTYQQKKCRIKDIVTKKKA